ncbi:Dabb family protein [Variovorax humicola]|uniref:Dabb family protein n=1 Tax=Variovorax humicola TaxID=1769758 RepID=A0ABU8W4C3_9BURK
MIRHVVLVRFKEHTTVAQRAQFVRAFHALSTRIAQVRRLESGVNSSPEGLDKGFTHCFLVSFDNPADRDAYLPHPAHQAFVQETGAWVADVLVVDYQTSAHTSEEST